MSDLKKWIEKRIEIEKETYEDARQLAGIDSPGANQAIGALEILNLVLGKLEQGSGDE